MLKSQVSITAAKRLHGPVPRREPAHSTSWIRGAPLVALLTVGCHRQHFQSMVHPKGPAASGIAELWWFLFALCSAIFAIVLVLTFLAVRRRSGEPRTASPLSVRFVVVSGIILPAGILVVLLFVSLTTQVSLRRSHPTTVIQVTGHQWWWEVKYPDQGITTANEIHIPVGETIGLELDSRDVIHSFWAPNLAGKLDALPDHVNRMTFQADEPGVYRGQCAEYCGTQHAQMAFFVVAMPKDEYQRWLDERQSPRIPPETEPIHRGLEVFFEAGCSHCHAIKDTRAKATVGPDLTHLGSRRSLAAGMLPNNRSHLADWITNPQAIKPGNRMPPTELAQDDLQTLVDYLIGP